MFLDVELEFVGGRAMEIEDDYTFMRIEDALTAIGQKVDIIGVVLQTSFPTMTSATDFSCSMKIVDGIDACVQISVNFVVESMDNLPHVRLAGDIIRLSRVLIDSFGEDLYAKFDRRFSSYAIYEGKYSKSYIPYQVSRRFQHAGDKTKIFVKNLRDWSIGYKLDTWDDSSSLKEIAVGENFNLYCKILHICKSSKDEQVIYVWDGNDTPSIPIQSKLEDEMKNSLPLQLEKKSLSRDLLNKFPAVGTILRVNVDLSNQKICLHLLQSEKFVKLIGIRCEIYNGFWRGTIMPYTMFRNLADNDPIVVEIQRIYDERVKSKWERMPLPCSWPSGVTELEPEVPAAPFVTLMNVLTHTEVLGKFRCVVRVVALLPWRVEDFCTPNGTYRIRLTLEDPTARIHAYLYAEDADTFFGGYPSDYELTMMRNVLLGVRESNDEERNPPWVQCCIKSYSIKDHDRWQNRRFRIFATRLVQPCKY